MLDKLPKWVVPNDVSVEQEVAEYRDMSLEDKAREIEALSRALAQLLAVRPDRAAILAQRDPLPESTIRALERLRRTMPR